LKVKQNVIKIAAGTLLFNEDIPKTVRFTWPVAWSSMQVLDDTKVHKILLSLDPSFWLKLKKQKTENYHEYKVNLYLIYVAGKYDKAIKKENSKAAYVKSNYSIMKYIERYKRKMAGLKK
jgi:hypothetical protein